jgi:hypothetical protein
MDTDGDMVQKNILAVLFVFLCACVALSGEARQDAPKQNPPAATETPRKRLTIEVTGGEKNVVVENASVYLKFTEVKKIGRDKKYALNVKTNREGIAHIPDAPTGDVLIQVVAEGWKTFGKNFEISDPGMEIKIHLDRPPKWY